MYCVQKIQMALLRDTQRARANFFFRIILRRPVRHDETRIGWTEQ